MIRESLRVLDLFKGYSLENYDEHFLKECSEFLPNLKEVKIEEIPISKLKCVIYSRYRSCKNIIKLVPVTKTPSYKYLIGDKDDFLNYYQYNYYGINNEKRLNETLQLIKQNGYPSEDKYIILFNKQNIVRDGQHRLAILAYLYGLEIKIKILRFVFECNDHIIKKNRHNFKIFLKYCYKTIYNNIKDLTRK